MSLFISFEGGEGSGKSTQAKMLADRLACVGLDSLFIHEPGSTELGGRIREWLKRGLPGGDSISARAELLLFSAARAELVSKILRPHLGQPDAAIVADRYVDSTVAYQGGGRGLPADLMRAVNALATQGVMPALTFLLDIPPLQGLARMGAVQYGLPLDDGAGHHTDTPMRYMEGGRFEDEPLDFHERVRKAYLDLAAADPDRWRVIDASQPIERISAQVWDAVCAKFPAVAARAGYQANTGDEQ